MDYRDDDSRRSRKARTAFSDAQLHLLESTFEQHKYLSIGRQSVDSGRSLAYFLRAYERTQFTISVSVYEFFFVIRLFKKACEFVAACDCQFFA